MTLDNIKANDCSKSQASRKFISGGLTLKRTVIASFVCLRAIVLWFDFPDRLRFKTLPDTARADLRALSVVGS